jgi:DNA helicase-2/ATP-dependent DNA helicase PcrA
VLEEVAAWDATIERLLAEGVRETRQTVDRPLPPSLSATSLARLATTRRMFARDLARPMPRQPSPAAGSAPGSTRGWRAGSASSR